MIGVMVIHRPAGWFTDPGCLAVMHALYCLRHAMELHVQDVVAALRRHGALEFAGGAAAVEALLEPGPHLEAGRADLAVARAALRPLRTNALVLLAQSLLNAVGVEEVHASWSATLYSS